jgi:hypothetical protein
LGFIEIIAGTAAFAVLSPLTAIASLPSLKGDAFVDLEDTLIVKPFKFTFVRPVDTLFKVKLISLIYDYSADAGIA